MLRGQEPGKPFPPGFSTAKLAQSLGIDGKELLGGVARELDLPRDFWVGCLMNVAQTPHLSISDVYFEIGAALVNVGRIDLGIRFNRVAFERKFGSAVGDAKYLHALMMSPEATKSGLLDAHREWARRHETVPNEPWHLRQKGQKTGNRIRVGYVCHFFGASTTDNSLTALIGEHDRSIVEVYAYNDGPEDAFGREIADHWRNTGELGTEAFAELVVDDEIDVLVEVNGFVPGNRYDALMCRPAKVQVNWGNYPSTTGLSCIDYLIADPVTVPREEACFYSEGIFHVDCQAISSNYHKQGFPDVAPPPVLRNGYITFGCFGSCHKHGRQVAELWMPVLNSLQTARLLRKAQGFQHDSIRDGISRIFLDQGLSPDRLILRPPSPYRELLEEYADIDVMLDTFPATGGATSYEALWQGVPVVTLRGDRWLSRRHAPGR